MSCFFSPIADNVTLYSNPSHRRKAGQFAHVPVLIGSNAQESRVFELGLSSLDDYLNSVFGFFPDIIPNVKKAYAPRVDGAESPYDIASQIDTEFSFQCPTALFSNLSAEAGVPAWRYYYNASFPNIQLLPGIGVYHGSEVPIIWETSPYPTRVNLTAQEDALSSFIQAAWANFAKNPTRGPGWNQVGTGGHYYGSAQDQDLGVIGTNGFAGVAMTSESAVDSRCSLFRQIYDIWDSISYAP